MHVFSNKEKKEKQSVRVKSYIKIIKNWIQQQTMIFCQIMRREFGFQMILL